MSDQGDSPPTGKPALLADKLRQTGSLSSADLAAAAPPTEAQSPPPPIEAELDSEIEVPETAAADLAASVDQAASPVSSMLKTTVQQNPELEKILKNPVTITAEDKARFMDAVASMGRVVLRTELFHGQAWALIRNKSFMEAECILQEAVNHLQITQPAPVVQTGVYWRFIHVALLYFQVAELHTAKQHLQYPEVPAASTLVSTAEPDGRGGYKLKQPAWVKEAFDRWGGVSPAICGELLRALVLFDKKYHGMTANANDESFWVPEDSIWE